MVGGKLDWNTVKQCNFCIYIPVWWLRFFHFTSIVNVAVLLSWFRPIGVFYFWTASLIERLTCPAWSHVHDCKLTCVAWCTHQDMWHWLWNEDQYPLIFKSFFLLQVQSCIRRACNVLPGRQRTGKGGKLICDGSLSM